MPSAFKIKEMPGLVWVPDHPEITNPPYFTDDPENITPFSAIIESLFGAVDGAYPGQYFLEDPVDSYKQQIFHKIDAVTAGLIKNGMSYDNKIFSLSLNAQTRYTAMLTASAYLTYPLNVNSLDDTGFVVLNSVEDVGAFCLTALGTVRAQVDSGTELKDQVRAATTTEELDAIVDSRA